VAQRVNVVLVDDLDGNEAAETVSFGLDGVDYEVDLSEAHAEDLRTALAPYIGVGRKTGGRRRKSGRASEPSASASEIREWARQNGWEVPDRGRVAAEVREAYAAAH
jgi:hypothetical protein